MWRVILLVFCYHVVSQPVTDEPQTRHTRELIECCPCPGSTHGGHDTLGRSLTRNADDCPCRLQSSDSEGASSMFFPTKTSGNPISSVPFMRSNDPNDMKNLLEPEVGLATSMLETLREATEEEYQDALARDAMRSQDAVPEESARNVVIIVKPEASDDEEGIVFEGSNIKEARCINPVGSPLRTASKPLRTLPDFFRLPKVKSSNSVDSNLGASNVQEKVLGTDGEVAGFNSGSPLFKLRTPLKENALKNSIVEKTPLVFDKLEHAWKNRPNLFERFNLPSIPKMKVDNPLQKNTNDNSDVRSAPSNIQERIEKDDGKGHFELNKRPLMFKNLLKLKDVELVPKTIPRIPIFKSKLNTEDLSFTSSNRDVDGTIKCKDTVNDSTMNENVFLPKIHKVRENVEAKNVPNENLGSPNVTGSVVELDEDHQDAITSPSEMIPIILDSIETNTVEPDESDCDNWSSETIMQTTNDSISRILEDGLNDASESAVESETNENTEIEDDINASKSCETGEFSENDVESTEPDMDSTKNIENITPLTSQESSISPPQIQKPEQVTTIPSDNDSEDFTSNIFIPEKTESNESKSEILIHNIKPIAPLTETLPDIKDNERKCLENIKKTTANINPAFPPEQSTSSRLRTDTPTIGDLDQELQNNELIKEKDNSNDKENLFRVTFNDLQKLSDDLLVLSSNENQNIGPEEIATLGTEDGARMFKPNKIQQETDEIKPDSLTKPIDKSEIVIPKGENFKLSKEKACHVDFDGNKKKTKSAQKFKSIIQNENKNDMSVEESAPVASTLRALRDPLNPLNLNEQLGASLIKLNPLDPLNLNEKLGSSLLPNLDPLNINDKLIPPVFPNTDLLNINEQRAFPLLPNLDPLHINEKLGSTLLDPLNLSEKLESFLQPNLDPLNVRSSLQNIIVQPTIPDDPLKFLGKPVADILKLPTLEDLRERLSSVFDNNDRSAENNFSDEDGDCSNINSVEMAPAASRTTLQKVPSMRPLEDMNVDIFQLNPLSKPDVFSSTPRLNLNNFRAKLPIPNNLDLKPVKLESRVANNKGNVLGAAFTFGNDKATLRKPKPNHSNLLGRPLGTLPSLDELRSSLQSGSHSLLGTPLQPNLDLFRDSNLRASGIPDLDEIRRNTEKTMKGLQQRIKSTFKGGNINPLSEKFAKPQDLLEDVNDKLKAIHYDLNDRLSSIHEDIFDQSRLHHLTNHVLSSIPTNRNANTNIMNNIRNKGKPARLQTSASTISPQEIIPLDNNSDRTLLRSPARSSPRRIQANHSSSSRTESAPVATKEELTKTTTATPKKITLSSLPLLPSLTQRQGSGNTFPQNIRENPLELPSQQSFVKDLKRPVLRKPNPFKDKNGKVTISFATTTASPVTSPMSQFKTTPPLKITDSDFLKERLALHKSKIFGDAKQSASELKPRIMTAATSKNNFKTADSDTKGLPQHQNLDSIENMKTGLSSYKGNRDSKLRLNEHNGNKLNSAWAFDNNNPEAKNTEVLAEKTKAKSLVWPKSGEDSFLTKVREAMQARLNNFHPAKTAEKAELDKVESPNTDMLRSASENNDVIVDEPLKENISYKCRMVCSRE